MDISIPHDFPLHCTHIPFCRDFDVKLYQCNEAFGFLKEDIIVRMTSHLTFPAYVVVHGVGLIALAVAFLKYIRFVCDICCSRRGARSGRTFAEISQLMKCEFCQLRLKKVLNPQKERDACRCLKLLNMFLELEQNTSAAAPVLRTVQNWHITSFRLSFSASWLQLPSGKQGPVSLSGQVNEQTWLFVFSAYNRFSAVHRT